MRQRHAWDACESHGDDDDDVVTRPTENKASFVVADMVEICNS